MQYIMRRPDVFPQDFHRLWRRAHDEALAASPYANDMFRRIVVSKRSRVNDNDAAARAHFKMVDPPVYDLVVSFTSTAWSRPAPSGSTSTPSRAATLEFADWSESFFLYVRQVRIIDDAPPKE